MISFAGDCERNEGKGALNGSFFLSLSLPMMLGVDAKGVTVIKLRHICLASWGTGRRPRLSRHKPLWPRHGP